METNKFKTREQLEDEIGRLKHDRDIKRLDSMASSMYFVPSILISIPLIIGLMTGDITRTGMKMIGVVNIIYNIFFLYQITKKYWLSKPETDLSYDNLKLNHKLLKRLSYEELCVILNEAISYDDFEFAAKIKKRL